MFVLLVFFLSNSVCILKLLLVLLSVQKSLSCQTRFFPFLLMVFSTWNAFLLKVVLSSCFFFFRLSPQTCFKSLLFFFLTIKWPLQTDFWVVPLIEMLVDEFSAFRVSVFFFRPAEPWRRFWCTCPSTYTFLLRPPVAPEQYLEHF